MEMIVKRAHYNNRCIGLFETSSENEVFSMTPMDFYDMFDAISAFLKDVRPYSRPKLYPTRNDVSEGRKKHYVKETWGNKYKLLIDEIDHSFGYNYGEYTIEFIKEMHKAMWEYVKEAKRDMIFECDSADVHNINHNPYTIYKDVFQEQGTFITLDMMVYFIVIGEWHYNSRTLGENIQHIREKYDTESIANSLPKRLDFQHISNWLKDKTTEQKYRCFTLLNNYKTL